MIPAWILNDLPDNNAFTPVVKMLVYIVLTLLIVDLIKLSITAYSLSVTMKDREEGIAGRADILRKVGMLLDLIQAERDLVNSHQERAVRAAEKATQTIPEVKHAIEHLPDKVVEKLAGPPQSGIFPTPQELKNGP